MQEENSNTLHSDCLILFPSLSCLFLVSLSLFLASGKWGRRTQRIPKLKTYRKRFSFIAISIRGKRDAC